MDWAHSEQRPERPAGAPPRIVIGARTRFRVGRGTTRLAVGAGILGSAALVVLGLVTSFDDPLRDQVDNAIVVLGGLGLLNAWLAGKAKLLTESNGVRAGLALFALLSAMALTLADFGAARRVGWAVKAAGLIVLGLVIADVLRRSRSDSV